MRFYKNERVLGFSAVNMNIKNTPLYIFAFMLVLTNSMPAAPIANESFTYTNGLLAGDAGGIGWSSAWANVSGAATETNGYALINAAGNQQIARQLPAQSKAAGTTVWLTFAAQQFTTGTGATATYGGLDLYNGGTEKLLFGKGWNANYVWGMGVGSLAASSKSTLTQATVYASIRYNPAGNDTVNFWINPTNPATLQYSNLTADVTQTYADLSFNEIMLRGGASIPESWQFGGIILSTNLLDVISFTNPVGPVIGVQPLGTVYALQGGVASVSVQAAADPAPQYQWLLNGTALTNNINFSGVNSNVLTISGVSLGSQGQYTCAISNSIGSITTTPASLIDLTNGYSLMMAYDGFQNYSPGNLVGQGQRGAGFASTNWSGTETNASVVTSTNGLANSPLDTWKTNQWGVGLIQTATGMVTLAGDGSVTYGLLDLSSNSIFRTAGYYDPTTAAIGGPNVTNTLYLSFLFQALSANRNNEYGGIQLVHGQTTANGVLIGNSLAAWAYSLYNQASGSSVNLLNTNGTGNYYQVDNTIKLFVAKIVFAGTNDLITVWMGPDATRSETNQNSANTYIGSTQGDFVFDRLALVAGYTNQFNIDEIRIGTTWASVLPPGGSQVQLIGTNIGLAINNNGTINSLEIGRTNGWNPVSFRTDGYAGPVWKLVDSYGTRSNYLTLVNSNTALYLGNDSFNTNIQMGLQYQIVSNELCITASITNKGSSPWSPVSAGILMGLDTYMASYPSWDYLYFPTMMRCERTHFWGYAMSPLGATLGFTCTNPVASWHNEYEPGGHRIYTFGFDFLNELPLPSRHPQNLTNLPAGQGMSWMVSLCDIPNNDPVSLSAVQPAISAMGNVPMISASRYTGEPGDTVSLTFWGNVVGANCTMANGYSQLLSLAAGTNGSQTGSLQLPSSGYGVLTVLATNNAGLVAEASINIRHPWSWYLLQARINAINKPQKDAGAQCEGYYGFYSMYLAKQWFPNTNLDALTDAKFNEIVPLMFNLGNDTPIGNPGRIQNTATMAGIFADRYKSDGNITNLQAAAGLSDYLVGMQGSDGAYYDGGAYYTSVIYIGKSILEVANLEKILGQTNAYWYNKYTNHFASVGRAMDSLAALGENIGTEGEATFEDGMISCSGTQLGMYALQETNQTLLQTYSNAAAMFVSHHRCLDQIVVPDARRNGGTCRFWEDRYDIITTPNFLCSPHGWSAWNIYGRWYLYQLTGNVEYLRQAMNAMGGCAQVVDPVTGNLAWSFCTDPFIRANVFVDNPASTNPNEQGTSTNEIIGEQYMPLISGWCLAPYGTQVSSYSGNDGGCNDNDVHEIFKCLEEVALKSAYLVIYTNNTAEAWNCTAVNSNGIWQVTPSEKIVNRIHVNAAVASTVILNFGGAGVTTNINGMQWVNSPVSNLTNDACTLIYQAGPNGAITGISSQTVSYGSGGSPVTAVPNLGYAFIAWSDGITNNPRLDSTAFSNLTVSASFTPAPAPVCVLSAPVGNAVYFSPANVNITAQVFTNGQNIISNTVFYFNNTNLIVPLPQAPYACTLSNLGAGNYTIMAAVSYAGYAGAGTVYSTNIPFTVLTGANGVWTNAAGGSWQNAGNWTNAAVANGTDQTADFSTLALTGNLTVTLDAGQTIGGIIFADQANAHSWTLNPGSGGTLNLSVRSNSPVINVSNQTATINAVITGSSGLTKAGAGSLILNQLNTYSGGTYVNAGTLWLAGPNNGASTVGTNTLVINSNAAVYANSGSVLGWDENGWTPAVVINGGLFSFQGNDGSAQNWTLNNGVLTGTGTGAGLYFNQPCTIASTGTSTISMAKISNQGYSPFIMVNSGVLDITSPINGNGGLTLVSGTNGGLLILSGGNTYTGGTVIQGGTLFVDGALAANSVVTVSGGTLCGDGIIGGPVQVQLGGTLAVGTNGAGMMSLAVNNSIALADGATCIMKISKNAGGLTNDVISGFTNLTYGGTLSVTNITSDSTQLGSGDEFKLFPPGAGSYFGAFTNYSLPPLNPGLLWDVSQLSVSGAIRVVSGTNALPPSFSIPPGKYIGARTVIINDGTPGATVYYTTNGLAPSTNSASGTSGISVFVPANASINIQAFATAAGYPSSLTTNGLFQTVSTPTWGNVAGGSWLQAVNWSNGIVASGSGVLTDFSQLTLTSNLVVTLDGAQTVGSMTFGDQGNAHGCMLNTGTGGPLTLAGSNSCVITVINQTNTIGLVLAGTNTLTVTGGGALALTNDNTYSGGTLVNSGTLLLQGSNDGNSRVGGGVLTVNPGAVVLASQNALGWDNSSSGDPCVVINGGTFNWQGNDGSAYGWTLNNGILTGTGTGTGLYFSRNSVVSAAGNSIISMAKISNQGNTMIVSNLSGILTVAGPINGSGGVTLGYNSSGVLVLGGTNTYTGTTVVSNGTLFVTGKISTNSVTVQGGGALLGHGVILGATIIQPAGSLQPGDLTGTNLQTLSISNNLTLHGSVAFVLNRTNLQNCSSIFTSGSVTCGGALTVSNVGPDLQNGDVFKIFGGTNFAGAFSQTNLPPLDVGLEWVTGGLSVNGTIAVTNVMLELLYTSGQGGTISGAATQAVPYEGNGTSVAAVPSLGYHFAGWTDGGTNASRMELDVTSNIAVTAVFATNPAPAVVWLNPTNGTGLVAPAALNLSVGVVTNGNLINGVYGTANGTNYLGFTAGVPYVSAWTNISAGSWSLVVGVVYNNNVTNLSAPLSIWVTNLPVRILNAMANSSNGSFSLNGLGGTNQTFVLDSTTNLSVPVWVPVTTNASDTNGLILLTDPNATNPWQFYRIEIR